MNTKQTRHYRSNTAFLGFDTITIDDDGEPETLEGDMPGRYDVGTYLVDSEYKLFNCGRRILKTLDGMYAFISLNDLTPFFVSDGESIDDAYTRNQQREAKRLRKVELTEEAQKLLASTNDHSEEEMYWIIKRLEAEMRCTNKEARMAIDRAFDLHREFGHWGSWSLR